MSALARAAASKSIFAKLINRHFSVSSLLQNSFKIQDEKDFANKIENSKDPIIVDFHASWCGPCRQLEPRLNNIMAKKAGKISLAKVDIDDFAEIAAKYDVGSIPALFVFRNGKVEERLVGLQDEDKLEHWVDKVIQQK